MEWVFIIIVPLVVGGVWFTLEIGKLALVPSHVEFFGFSLPTWVLLFLSTFLACTLATVPEGSIERSEIQNQILQRLGIVMVVACSSVCLGTPINTFAQPSSVQQSIFIFCSVASFVSLFLFLIFSEDRRYVVTCSVVTFSFAFIGFGDTPFLKQIFVLMYTSMHPGFFLCGCVGFLIAWKCGPRKDVLLFLSLLAVGMGGVLGSALWNVLPTVLNQVQRILVVLMGITTLAFLFVGFETFFRRRN